MKDIEVISDGVTMKGKATKKPVNVDFFRWDGNTEDNRFELTRWCASFKDNVWEHFTQDSEGLKVKTLEGTSYNVPKGYIIIRGVEGEYYPCEPGIFVKTYNFKK